SPLELEVQVEVSRDRPHAPAARPVGLHRLPRRPLHLRMGGEVEVVVRREHHDLLAVHRTPWRARPLEHPRSPVQALPNEGPVLRPHPARRISCLHRHASMGNATFPQSPLRITSIAFLY